MVNRATKRLMAKQQRADAKGAGGGGGRGTRGTGGGDDFDEGRPRRGAGRERIEKKRTPPRQFLREVRTELKKVAWPSRKEVATYTVVVLVSVIFVTLIVFGLDYGFNQVVFRLYSN